MNALKLGKRAARHDPRTPRLAALLPGDLPPPPPSCDHGATLHHWQSWRNCDRPGPDGQVVAGLGDCTAVSVASAIRVWTAARGGQIELDDRQVVGIYEANGYDPARPETDRGAVELDVLKQWCSTGYNIGRQAPDVLSGFASVDPQSFDHVRRAIAMLGGLYVGLGLPDYALAPGAAWSRPSAPYEVAGGHAVFVHGYDAQGLWLNSWGERKRMDWQFFREFCDEAYGLVCRDWLDLHGMTPMKEAFLSLSRELSAAKSR